MTTTKATELRSFPPIEDGIDFIKQVDWEEFGTRFRGGIRNLLLVALKFSEASYDMHSYFLKKLDA